MTTLDATGCAHCGAEDARLTLCEDGALRRLCPAHKEAEDARWEAWAASASAADYEPALRGRA